MKSSSRREMPRRASAFSQFAKSHDPTLQELAEKGQNRSAGSGCGVIRTRSLTRCGSEWRQLAIGAAAHRCAGCSTARPRLRPKGTVRFQLFFKKLLERAKRHR